MSTCCPHLRVVISGRLRASVWASLILLVVLGLAPANAMLIERTIWRDRPVLRLSGEIIAGDAVRLQEELPGLPMWPHGAPVVLLDSVGGSVAEAMRISNLFDRVPVHAVIPQGGRCASACASILFIAGRYRTVDPGGLLGQHSCSRNGVADSGCNAALAEHAVAHGVSYGSVAAFVTYVAPENVAWHTREQADCLGLTKYP